MVTTHYLHMYKMTPSTFSQPNRTWFSYPLTQLSIEITHKLPPPQGALILFLSHRQLWSQFIAYAHTPTSLQFIFRLKTQSDMICLLISAVSIENTQNGSPPKVLLTLFPFDLTFDYGHNSQHRHPLIPSTFCIKTSTLSEAIYPLINAIIYRWRTHMTPQQGAVDPIFLWSNGH